MIKDNHMNHEDLMQSILPATFTLATIDSCKSSFITF